MLLWNYPGQAFTEWREEQLLNNEYIATILQFLFVHLGKKSKGGTGERVTLALLYTRHTLELRDHADVLFGEER